MFTMLRKRAKRNKARAELRGMSDRELRDIGITRADINRLVI